MTWDKFDELVNGRLCVIITKKVCEPKNTDEACKVCYEMLSNNESLLGKWKAKGG